MNNYKIITDPILLNEFIEWLPDISVHEVFYGCLFSRSKYCNTDEIRHIKTDKQQVSRFIVTKLNLLYKIQQLECPLGTYRQRDLIIPQESLALYINPNPRSMIKATYSSLHRLVDLTKEQYSSNNFNLVHEVLSEIQKSKSRMVYMDFDFDDISLERLLELVEGKVNINALHILQTRGGFHLLIEISKVEEKYKKTWYNNLTSLVEVDIKGDQMIPVPGCIQGMFTPKFINF
jgi:hypothetical protein